MRGEGEFQPLVLLIEGGNHDDDDFNNIRFSTRVARRHFGSEPVICLRKITIQLDN